MIADAHFHFEDLEESDRSALLGQLPGSTMDVFLGLSAGVWPKLTSQALATWTDNGRSVETKSTTVVFAGGLHPAYLHRHGSKDDLLGAIDLAAEELEMLAAAKQLAAIGETGFDRSQGVLAEAQDFGIDRPTLEHAQDYAFQRCADLAIRHRLPLVIHTRSAWESTVSALEGVLQRPPPDLRPRVMIHCFPGAAAEAARLAQLGVYLSFGGVLTWPTARRMREAIVRCPAQRLLLETDAPDLAPVLSNGTRPTTNAPRFWPTILHAAAALRGEDPAATEQLACNNLREFLGMPRRPD